MHKKRFILSLSAAFCTIFMCCVLLSSCSEEYEEGTSFAMGSFLQTKIYTSDKAYANELLNKINTLAADTDKALSATDKSSELSQLNKEGDKYASPYLIDAVSRTVRLCNKLDGKADITVGSLSSLWGFSSDAPSLPSHKDIEAALSLIGTDRILIDKASDRITLSEGTMLDFGAFGKGEVCDRIYNLIKTENTPVLVSVGGTIMVYGEGPDKGCWKIGIRNPFSDTMESFAVLSTDNLRYDGRASFISTSGSYEKNFTADGQTYHHILDTKNGYPVENELISVTAVADTGLNADGLSTALFANGFNESSLQYLEALSAEAVFVFKDGSYYVTEGLKDSFRLKNKDFTEATYEEKVD